MNDETRGKVLQQFVAKVRIVEDQLARLQAHVVCDHMNRDYLNLDYGDIGDISYVIQQLDEALAFLGLPTADPDHEH